MCLKISLSCTFLFRDVKVVFFFNISTYFLEDVWILAFYFEIFNRCSCTFSLENKAKAFSLRGETSFAPRRDNRLSAERLPIPFVHLTKILCSSDEM